VVNIAENAKSAGLESLFMNEPPLLLFFDSNCEHPETSDEIKGLEPLPEALGICAALRIICAIES
jgi:hypothetical protein